MAKGKPFFGDFVNLAIAGLRFAIRRFAEGLNIKPQTTTHTPFCELANSE
jgi:hypothetical protein